MISKLVSLCILGIFVRNAHSQFQTMNLSAIRNLDLDESAFTKGSHPVRQLNCTSNEDLCFKYGITSATAVNALCPNGLNWTFHLPELPEFIKYGIKAIECEHVNGTTEMGTQLIIKDSCRLSYVLKLKTVRMPISLKFRNYKLTTGRQPVQQLRCVGGQICDSVNVTYVVCTSMAIAGPPNWSCFGENVPLFVRFDNISVACENSTFRSQVVEGSCHMNYSLTVPTQTLDSNVKLVLSNDRQTMGFKKLPELTCVGDKILCDLYAPSTVVCTNTGYINGSIKWNCRRQHENIAVRFGRQNVSCESAPGFEHAKNVVIKYSCSLRYTLIKAEIDTSKIIPPWTINTIPPRKPFTIPPWKPFTIPTWKPNSTYPLKRDSDVRVGLWIGIFVGIVASGAVVVIFAAKCQCNGGSTQRATYYSNPINTVAYTVTPHQNCNVNIEYCATDFSTNDNQNCGGNDYGIGSDNGADCACNCDN